ncbi:MAG: metallophosphoesterase [Lachnospiraceae bacterium]|nr:metallophosphoesterase [Lachnospiraceae bacterium]
MKIIHCADLHFDSKLNANLEKESAKQRKAEILHTFARMVAYAADNEVKAILIAGDLFDTGNTSATARNAFLHEMVQHPDINFYYLRGNHDQDIFLFERDELPENLRTFDAQWKTYTEEEGKITISGIEFPAQDSDSVYLACAPDAEKFNIVMLHGQEGAGSAKDRTEIINLKALRNKGIDYIALGHVHAYKKETLDARGVYCYCGCLEGRGFDECGEHGFVLLDVDAQSGKYTHTFVPFAKRRLYAVEADVTGCLTTAEMAETARQALAAAGCGKDDLIKIVLKGMVDVACEKDIVYFQARFASDFYFVKVCDETTLLVDVEDYMRDASLKGEFVRQVMEDESIPKEDKKAIIRYGLQAIAGEEIQ